MKKYLVLLAFVAFFALFRLFCVEPTHELQRDDVFKDCAHIFVGGLLGAWLQVRSYDMDYPPLVTQLVTDRDFYWVTGWGLVALEIIAFLIGKYT
jgi:hypothetical protein